MNEELIRCGADGVFIWPGLPLVEKRGAFYTRVSDRDIANRAGVLFGPDVVYGPLFPMLERAARHLERGQMEQAQAAMAKLKLPSLTLYGERLMRSTYSAWRKEFDPDEHPRWPAGAPDSTGGEFAPKDGHGSAQVAQEFLPFFARPPVIPDEPEFQEPIPRLSGKDGSKDVPSWARGQRPYIGENGRDFAKRIMDEKYGPGNWGDDRGTMREFRQIQKYGDRNFRDPKAIVPSDDDNTA